MTASYAAHGHESARVHRLARQLSAARERATAARWYGDESGARIAAADARRIARILAED